MRREKQRILAALLSLVLLLALAPAGWAANVNLDAKNRITVDLAPDKTEEYKNDIASAGVQADLYLVAKAKAVDDFDTYEYEDLPESLSSLQAQLNEALQTDPVNKPEEIEDQMARQDTMLKKFTALAYDMAGIILADGFSDSSIRVITGNAVGSTVTIGELDAGLYLLVLRGSNLTNKKLTLKVENEDEEYGYVTATKKQLSANDENGKEEKEHLATRAFSDRYEYLFEPQLISVPTKIDSETGMQQYNTAFGDWSYDITVNVKAAQEARLGKLKLYKTLSSYLDLSKDPGYSEPATVSFDIIGRKTNNAAEGITYRRQVTMNFDGPDSVGKMELLKDIPAGTWVWVDEVYQGAHYRGSSQSNMPVEIKADRIDVVNSVTAVTSQASEAKFDNTNNNIHRGGHGIENVFTYDGNTWTGEGGWTTDPAAAKGGNPV